MATARMLVPEASVNEDHFAPAWEYDVRCAW